jgi:hypothetical protein
VIGEPRFKEGDVVKITSKVSKARGGIGIVVGYCNSYWKPMAKVKHSERAIVRFYDDGLELFERRDA